MCLISYKITEFVKILHKNEKSRRGKHSNDSSKIISSPAPLPSPEQEAGQLSEDCREQDSKLLTASTQTHMGKGHHNSDLSMLINKQELWSI